MTVLNHSLTGVSIAIIVEQPLIGLPLAFLSHFLLDMLPHFGEPIDKRKKFSRAVWIVSGLMTLALYAVLIANSTWYLLLAGVVAMSPDFVWFYRFIVDEKFGTKPPKPRNWFNEIHASIQHYESRWGLVVEVLYFAVLAVFVGVNI